MAGSFSAFFTGLGATRWVMVVDTLAMVLNGLLDYGWIFGHWGLPALGIGGAAWATVSAQWFRMAVYFVLLMLPRYRRPYGLWSGRRLDPPLMRRLLRYGVPSGLQLFVEIATFTLFVLLLGKLGEKAMAATTLAFNLNVLAFMPMIGLSIALSTLVGHELGRDRPDLASRATWISLLMAAAYMGAMALAYVLMPKVLMLGYALGASPEQFAEIESTTVVLLRFVAVYCLFDAMNVIFAGTLRGAGDTRFILLTSLLLTPCTLAATWVGVHWQLGLLWCWCVITAWVCSLGLIYGARFLTGRWKQMRVIEPESGE